MKSLLLLAAAASISGCSLWYKPVKVANAIGEERAVLAGDTLNAYREDRFEVYGPNVEAVYDGYEQLNRAYRAFERFFGAPAPRLGVLLARDSAQPVDAAALALRDRGFFLVRYVRPRSLRRRYGGLDYGGNLWPLAPTAGRALLARYAESRLRQGQAVPQTERQLLERFPLWYRAAVMHLVGEAGSAANDLDYMRDKRGDWRPLSELLTFARSATEDATLDPSRRGDADDFTRIFAAQASMLARYLAEREGVTVLGRLADGYLAGRTFDEMAAAFASAAKSVPELERRFRIWIETLEN